MDSAYANALKRKEELENELRDVETFLSLYRRFQGSQRQENNPDSPPSNDDLFVNDGYGRKVRALRPPEIADRAEELIRAAKRPLTRAEIVKEMERLGYVLNSDDKPRYVGTILWRQKDRFTNIPGEGYITTEMATRDQRYENILMMARGDEEPDDGSETGEVKKSD